MPELPDITIYLERLDALIARQPLERMHVMNPFVLRSVAPTPAALAGRLSPVRRAVVAVAALAGLAGVMFLISTVPLPWRLLAVGPIIVFVLVIGAAGIIDGERERTQARLRRADEEIERLATIAERERIA